MSEIDIEKYLKAFVDELRHKGCLKTEWLADAVLAVPRHLFIDQYYEMGYEEALVIVDQRSLNEENLKAIYSDRGLMIRKPPNHSAASQPNLVLSMLYHLELQSGNRVLEVGTGSGWNAALMAFRVGEDRLVHSVDIQSDLVEVARKHLQAAGFPQVNLMSADGGNGWKEQAPFDRIIITVGSPDIPPAWLEQLNENGILLVPFKIGGVGDPLLWLRKQNNEISGRFVGWSGFMTLQGAFWSDSEDILSPPWDPKLEQLLNRTSEKLTIPEPVDIHWLFFLHLKGMRLRSVVDYTKQLGFTPTVLDTESESVFVLSPNEVVIQVYGDLDTGKHIVSTVQEWIDLGKPQLTDYTVRVSSKLEDEEGTIWRVCRPNVNFNLTLKQWEK